MDSYNKDMTELHREGNFVIHLCRIRDPYLEEEVLAYGIYNTITNVREGEARRLVNAIAQCDDLGRNPEAQIELALDEARH